MPGLVVDLFAGFGGASMGIEAALGRPVDIAVNHDPVAIACHEDNHADTLHLHSDVFEVDPLEVTRGRPVDVLWASPDCTHFSRAKGGKPRKKNIRALAWVVRDWARLTRPRRIFMENVAEFRGWGPLDDDGHPINARAGETFDAFVAALTALGYRVEHRLLNAADYGAPTARTRLFLVAARDREPIEWPEPTHGPGREHPHRTAAECIDWSIPCPSIFLTPEEVKAQGLRCRRPLAEKTMKRIAEGVRRFVLEAGDPFIVRTAHGDSCSTGAKRWGKSSHSGGDPIPTITASKDYAVVAPTLIQTGHGERPGQRPRVPGLHKPLGTVCAGGCKRGLVAAFLTKHYGGVVGHELTRPTGTVTATDHHALTVSHLSKMRGTSIGSAMDAPVPTITGGGLHLAEVRAFFIKYYGTGGGSSLNEPLHTITGADRMGLVMVRGEAYQIVDIGMRMLAAHELLAAQFGRFAPSCSLDGVKTERDKVRLIGNSVCPVLAEALVGANVDTQEAGLFEEMEAMGCK